MNEENVTRALIACLATLAWHSPVVAQLNPSSADERMVSAASQMLATCVVGRDPIIAAGMVTAGVRGKPYTNIVNKFLAVMKKCQRPGNSSRINSGVITGWLAESLLKREDGALIEMAAKKSGADDFVFFEEPGMYSGAIACLVKGSSKDVSVVFSTAPFSAAESLAFTTLNAAYRLCSKSDAAIEQSSKTRAQLAKAYYNFATANGV